MFKRPRKTIHKDNRKSCESIHEAIMERLDESKQSEYLADVMPFILSLEENSTKTLRIMFKNLARDWMTKDELHSFDTDIDNLNYIPTNYCKSCEKTTSFILNEVEACRICQVCGTTVQYIGASSQRYLPYDFEAPQPSCPYRRSNHFQEWLNSFMARQSTTIPAEVFDAIRVEMKKLRITDAASLTHKRLRTIMKTLRLNKYYEHSPFIIYHLKGEKPPTLTREVEDELKQMFDIIQAPFVKVVNLVVPERRNFLSYSYTIYKMLQLIELDYLLIYFPLLKSREKLIVQDKIWKGICHEVGWRYIPSV